MIRRAEPCSFTEFVGDDGLGRGILTGLFVVIAAGIISCIVYSLAWGDHNMRIDTNIRMEKVFLSHGAEGGNLTPAMREKRRRLAQDALNLYERSAAAGEPNFTTFEEGDVHRIAAVAKTGEPLRLDMHKWKFSSFFRAIFGLWGLLAIWSFVGLCGVWSAASDSPYRLADLPWRRGWPLVVTLVLGPIGWLAMGVSAYLLRDMPQVGANPTTPVEALARAEALNVGYANRTARYKSRRGKARNAYRAIRLGGVQKYRNRQVEYLTQEISCAESRARSASSNLREIQGQLGELRAQKRLLEEIQPETVLPDPSLPDEEFDRIIRLPGVIAVQVEDGGVRLVVRATYRHEGTLYDLGDWAIGISSELEFTSEEMRNAVRPTWGRGKYPSYYYRGGEFCFGDHATTIREHIMKGQILQAFEVAVRCLHAVNEGNENLVPRAFYPIDEEGEPNCE